MSDRSYSVNPNSACIIILGNASQSSSHSSRLKEQHISDLWKLEADVRRREEESRVDYQRELDQKIQQYNALQRKTEKQTLEHQSALAQLERELRHVAQQNERAWQFTDRAGELEKRWEWFFESESYVGQVLLVDADSSLHV